MSHILLIEDYCPHAQLMGLDLTEAGYRVSAFASGEAALAALPRLTINLILLDWQLPGCSGLEICQRLRAAGYTQPIIFVTASANEGAAATAIAAGANAYFIKPFSPQTLIKTLESLLNQTLRDPDPQPLEPFGQ